MFHKHDTINKLGKTFQVMLLYNFINAFPCAYFVNILPRELKSWLLIYSRFNTIVYYINFNLNLLFIKIYIGTMMGSGPYWCNAALLRILHTAWTMSASVRASQRNAQLKRTCYAQLHYRPRLMFNCHTGRFYYILLCHFAFSTYFIIPQW